MKTIINTSKAPEPIGPYNQSVKFGNLLFTSGQIAIDPATGELKTSSIEEETKLVMENLRVIIEEAGTSFEDVIKATIFISNMDNFEIINKIYGTYFNEATAPARETVEVSKLPRSVNVEISMIVGLSQK